MNLSARYEKFLRATLADLLQHITPEQLAFMDRVHPPDKFPNGIPRDRLEPAIGLVERTIVQNEKSCAAADAIARAFGAKFAEASTVGDGQIMPDSILFDVEKQWQAFSALVYSHNVSSIQLQECKRAFYAGVEAIRSIMFRIGEDDISEARGMEVLDGVSTAVNTFSDLLKRGRA